MNSEVRLGATRVEALHYRSLRYVSQALGPFHVLVGPNASGKSNFLDVLAFIGDVLSTDLPTAVLGDDRWNVQHRTTDARDLVWDPYKSGGRWRRSSFELAVEMAIPEYFLTRSTNRAVCRYEIEIEALGEPEFLTETLWLKPDISGAEPTGPPRGTFPCPRRPPSHIALQTGSRIPDGWDMIVSRGLPPERVSYKAETGDWAAPFQISATKSALANLPEDHALFPVALWFRQWILAAERIVLSGEAMRRPCPPIRRQDFLPDGSNLPHVVQELADSHPEQHARWVRHVQEVLPDIVNVSTREREEDRHRYLVLEHPNQQESPSWLISDGTLRLLALTLLAYLPELSGIYLIEEPENGLHPRAVETVFQSLSSVYEAQILLTTHSPLVARLTEPDRLLCLGRDETAGTDIVSGSEHPHLQDWQGTADLGTLLASGILG